MSRTAIAALLHLLICLALRSTRCVGQTPPSLPPPTALSPPPLSPPPPPPPPVPTSPPPSIPPPPAFPSPPAHPPPPPAPPPSPGPPPPSPAPPPPPSPPPPPVHGVACYVSSSDLLTQSNATYNLDGPFTWCGKYYITLGSANSVQKYAGWAVTGTTSVYTAAACVAALEVRLQQQAQVANALGSLTKYTVSTLSCCNTALCNTPTGSAAARSLPAGRWRTVGLGLILALVLTLM